MKTIESIIRRAWIVLSVLTSLIMLAVHGESNGAFAMDFIVGALVGVPIGSYTIYRLTRFVFHGN